MTENTSMAKEKKGTVLPVQVNENKDIFVTLKKKKMNIRKKRGCSSLQHRKKTSVKQKVKQKAKQKNAQRSRKVPKKLTVSNMLLKCNKEVYEHQIKQLNLVLKQSLNCPTLTQDELKTLFMKYKLDGHYKPNKNLPPFASLIDNMNTTMNGKHFYDETQCTSIPDIQRINYKNCKEATENLYCHMGNENQHTKDDLSMYRNMQLNLKHDPWKPTDILKESNVDNKIDNKYLYIEQSSVIDSNYNHMVTNYDTQMCNNTSVFNDIQNFDQSKSNIDVNRISNVEEEQFSYNLTNAHSILPEDQSYRYANESLLCNLLNSNVQYENINSSSDTSQQNDMQYPILYNDLPWNQNLCNNFHSNNWNDNVSSINKTNFHSWKSEQPICTPYTNNLESYYHKNHFEEQSNFNSHAHTNVYRLMDSENLSYVANNNSINSQQDCNSYYTSSSTVASSNFLPDTNTFTPSYTNISDQMYVTQHDTQKITSL